jgi:hypothetical protein
MLKPEQRSTLLLSRYVLKKYSIESIKGYRITPDLWGGNCRLLIAALRLGVLPARSAGMSFIWRSENLFVFGFAS